MNNLLRLLALFFVTSPMLAVNGEVVANSRGPAISLNEWEQHTPEGISVVMTLSQLVDTGGQENVLNVYIKNTSSSELQFDDRHYDSGVKLYYIGGNGTLIPLHDYGSKDGIQSINNSFPSYRKIASGKILQVTIRLTPNEFTSLRSYPVKCVFTVFNPAAKYVGEIKSTPRMLSIEP